MIALEDLLPSLQGALPASIATCALDGTPNISYLSQLQYVDPSHVAICCQFFNKTRRNLEENPRATLVVLDPVTMRAHRLLVRFARSQTEGPLFEEMSAQLEAMASLIGMQDQLRLHSADVFEVLSIERVEADVTEDPPVAADGRPDAIQLRVLGTFSQRLARVADLDGLFRSLFTGLEEQLGLTHILLLLADEPSARVFTIASHGYPEEGVGSEVRFGEGIIGTAAKTRRSIRVGDVGSAMLYARAVAGGAPDALTGIPLPGLKCPQSCVAVPLLWYGELVGVLAAESSKIDAFSARDEMLLGVLANQIAPAVRGMLHRADSGAPPAPVLRAPSSSDRRMHRFVLYRSAETIFIDGEYLIRYVPAQILWRLLQLRASEGRVEFTNRELRMDPAIRLPPLKDNLEARLLLLRKRLEQKCPDLRMVPAGRGRFRLEAACEVEMVERDTP